jgi:hypothetical protein
VKSYVLHSLLPPAVREEYELDTPPGGAAAAGLRLLVLALIQLGGGSMERGALPVHYADLCSNDGGLGRKFQHSTGVAAERSRVRNAGRV